MKKLLCILLLVLVGIGFYRGWIALSSSGRDENDKVTINLTVDPDKAKADAEKMREKTRELGDRSGNTAK